MIASTGSLLAVSYSHDVVPRVWSAIGLTVALTRLGTMEASTLHGGPPSCGQLW